MMTKKLCTLFFTAFLLLPNLSKSMDDVSVQIQSAMALGGLAVTAGLTKFVSKNKKIKDHAPKLGVSSGELAVVSGLMGGFFSLSNSLPGAARYGWLVPVLYGCYKLSNNKILNGIIANTPNIGKYLAGRDIRKTREIMSDPNGEIYTKQKNPELYAKEDSKEYVGPTFENVGKSAFAGVAITAFLYEFSKIILQKSFNYPDCFVNWGGRAVGSTVNFILNNNK